MSGTQEIRAGTYTVMGQVAADALGVFIEQVQFELGDTQLPRASSSGGLSTTARSKVMGGIVFGIGMALLEYTVVDERLGYIVNANLGEYHLPVNAELAKLY